MSLIEQKMSILRERGRFNSPKEVEDFFEAALTQLEAETEAQVWREAEEKYADIFSWLLGEKGDFPYLAEKPHYKFRSELRKKLDDLPATIKAR